LEYHIGGKLLIPKLGIFEMIARVPTQDIPRW